MSVKTQLKLLLWKNWTSHRRQKLRVFIEIVWPLFLMFILMWVRTRGLKDFIHECHFDEKALPSAGFFTFLANALCTFNNTCHAQVTDGVTQVGPGGIVNDTFTPVLENVVHIFGRHLSADTFEALPKVSQDFEALSLFVKAITDPDRSLPGSSKLKNFVNYNDELKSHLKRENISLAGVESLLNAEVKHQAVNLLFDFENSEYLKQLCTNKSVVGKIFKVGEHELENLYASFSQLCLKLNSSPFEKFVQYSKFLNTSSITKEVVKFIELSTGRKLHASHWLVLSNTLSKLLKDLASIEGFDLLMNPFYERLNSFKNAVQNPTNNSTLAIVQSLFCKGNKSDLSSQFGGSNKLNEFQEEIKQQFIRFSDDENATYVDDKTTTAKCNAIMKRLESGHITRVLWRQMKPFVRGKIIYAPDSPVVRKIISKVNSTFDPISATVKTSEYWLTTVAPAVENFLANNTDLLAALTNLTSNVNLTNFTPNLSNTTISWTLLNGLNALLKFLNTDGSVFLSQMNQVLQELHDHLQCIELNKFEAFSNEKQIVQKGLELVEENKLWAAVVFENIRQDDKSLPATIRYKIRMDTSKIDSTRRIEDRISRPGPRRRPGIDLKYITFGFSYLQDMIEHAIIEEHSGKSVGVGIYLQQFPSPCFTYDQFILAISRSFPLFMVLSWIYNSSMIIKSIVYEKEKRLKEVMKVMGLSNGILWLSWFADSFLFMSFSCLLLTFILVGGNILEHSDPSVILAFLICYCISVILQSFMFSTLFSKANMAAAAGGLLFFLSYLPYPFLVLWEDALTKLEKTLLCLVPNIAFGFGCSYLAHHEETGFGAQWDNLFQSPIPSDKFGLGYVMFLLLKDAIVFGVLAWYIEAVFPGEYGVPKPWYFFLTKRYWCGTVRRGRRSTEDGSETSSLAPAGSEFEPEPTNLPLGISISKLTKVYNGCKLALDNLTMNFYEGQITSFLGHNGAGKTTTISILTGLITPTSGTAKVYDQDIRRDMDSIRKNLGTCPQHNVLFSNLTVYEHLWFYSLLKGSQGIELYAEITQMIKDLGLIKKRNEFSKNLSGGMQRKLSVAIAFIGGSRTVILDEPTAGVDPYSRRSIWELMLKYKSKRTVILTTHHMDEADLLGDRIAVISQGKLKCCGSSLFLKSKFGSGYYLTLAKDKSKVIPMATDDNEALSCVRLSEESCLEPSNVHENEDEGVADIVHAENSDRFMTWKGDCTTPKVTQFIRTFLPQASLVENVGSELSYLLPFSSKNSGALQNLLESLDRNLDLLQISSYGISDTTLEEVFLKVTGALDERTKTLESINSAVETFTEGGRYPSRLRLNSLVCNALVETSNSFRANDLTHSRSNPFSDHTQKADTFGTAIPLNTWAAHPKETLVQLPLIRETGWPLVKRQFLALLIRRFHHTRRNTKGLFCEIVLPAVFILFSMIFTLVIPPVIEEPPLELQPWLYGPPNYLFFTDESHGSPRVEKYVNELLDYPGIGTKCIEGVRRQDVKIYGHSRNSWSDVCHERVVNRSALLPTYDLEEANKLKECSCSLGYMHCPENAGGPEPPSVMLPTGDILYNVTGRNVSDWITKSYKQYYKKRYGGFSFGFRSILSTMNHTAILMFFDKALKSTKPGTEANQFLNLTRDLYTRTRENDAVNNMKVWFNNKGWASSVSYQNALNNLILRANLPKPLRRHYGITVINHPMNYTKAQLKDQLLKRGGLSLLHSICVLFAMSFVPASFVLYLIEDRITGSKHLQFVSGVSPYTYWISSYVWDLTSYLIPTTLCTLICVAFDAEAYVSEENVIGFILLLFLYGFASIPMMYPTAYMFRVPSSAFVVLACGNLFIGVITTVSTFVLELFDDEDLQLVGALLKKLFLVFPHYCLGRGLMEMSTNHLASQAFAQFGLKIQKNLFSWNFLGKNFFFMVLQGTVAFAVVLLIESGFFTRRRDPETLKKDEEKEDEDVTKERERVLAGGASNAVLLVKSLTKVYDQNQMPAVDSLCMAVEPGECFGLLGVNGAGKTTTFKMLTGAIRITKGDAFVSGFSVRTETDYARQHIGYCPQFDALDPLLTGKEQLEFYARLRGIPEYQLDHTVTWGIKKLQLSNYANFCAGTYSGGNKRKLSTAIALIGNPSVVFLDEPTTGMDPKARRFLWNCIMDVIREGCSVILTSHSMEECEALCTRLAIMVNGRFRCLGSIQHLKNKFGEGYTVTIRLNRGTGDLDVVKAFIQRTFGDDAVLKEIHLNQMEYQISSQIGLASIFKELEQAKLELNIEDYSVSQTTLDQMFITFARMQSDSPSP